MPKSSQAKRSLQSTSGFAKPEIVLKAIAFLIFLYFNVRNAWIGDDAFITMRAIDNWLNGYGLVWNVGERVQAFTHPLWLFLLTPFYAITGDAYTTLYGVSLSISLVTFGLMIFRVISNHWVAILLTMVLLGSMAYMDFSSSGLENPLTHFLLLVTVWVLIEQNRGRQVKPFVIFLLASFTALNRLDTILFFVPLLLYLGFLHRHSRGKLLLQFHLAFIPLIAWWVFATFYYGFPLPNTYYAKSPTNLPNYYFYEKGIAYLVNSLKWDPITLITMSVGFVLVAASRDRTKIALASGVLMYIIYTLVVGGDFMSGRFLSAGFMVMVLVLMDLAHKAFSGPRNLGPYWFLLLCVLIISLLSKFPPLLIQKEDWQGQLDGDIANEKLFYFQQLGMLNYLERKMPHRWGISGIRANGARESPVIRAGVGSFGYYVGPKIYVVDVHALPDVFRARLPAVNELRVGHFERPIPAGFLETIRDHYTNRIENPDMKEYYAKISILIHDDLWNSNRLRTIFDFNLGKFNHLVDSYKETK